MPFEENNINTHIFVISSEVVEKWSDSTAESTKSKYSSVLERYEEIFNEMSAHYQKIKIQLILLDIQLCTEGLLENQFNLIRYIIFIIFIFQLI